MPNPFISSFPNQQPNPQSDILSQIGMMRQNPNQFLANQIAQLSNQGIQIPQEYQNNPELAAKYLLQNTPGLNQNRVFQIANMLRSTFGIR